LSVLVFCPFLYSFHQSSFLVPKETYAVVAIAVACVARALAGPLRPVFRAGRFGAALVLFAAVSAISTLWSVSLYWTFRATVGACLAVVFYALVAERCRNRKFIARGLAAIAITGAAVAALSVLQLAGPGRLLFPQFAGNPQIMYSTFGNDSIVAGYLVVAAPLLAGYVLSEDRRGTVAVAMGATLLVIYALLALQTRGAWIALILAALCVLAALTFTGRRALAGKTVRPLTITICGLAVFAIVQATIPGTATGNMSLIERIRSTFDRGQPGVADRVKMTLAAGHIIMDHPVTGTGAGTFGYLAPRYQAEVYEKRGRPAVFAPSQEHPFTVHNEYVQTVAEMGLAGWAAMLALLISGAGTVTRVWRQPPTKDRLGNLLVCGGTGTILAVAVLATTHFPFRVASHSLAFLFTIAAFYGYYHTVDTGEQQVGETSHKPSGREIKWCTGVVCLVSLVMCTAAVWNMVVDRLYWDGFLAEDEQAGVSRQALDKLQTAARFDRFNGRTSAAYGWALANRGRWDEALEQLSRALDTWDMAALHFNLGVVNEQLGRTDEAARAYRAALYRDPGMTEAIVKLRSGQKETIDTDAN
jgi:O-antigen ligase